MADLLADPSGGLMPENLAARGIDAFVLYSQSICPIKKEVRSACQSHRGRSPRGEE